MRFFQTVAYLKLCQALALRTTCDILKYYYYRSEFVEIKTPAYETMEEEPSEDADKSAMEKWNGKIEIVTEQTLNHNVLYVSLSFRMSERNKIISIVSCFAGGARKERYRFVQG